MLQSNNSSKKEQRCKERINRRKEEAKLIAETEETKCNLDIGLLKIHLQNVIIQTEDYEEERDDYLLENDAKIQKYPLPDEASNKKGKIMLWGVLLLDFVVGFITMGSIISEGILAIIGNSFAAAALFYVAGYWGAATEKDPDSTTSKKGVASILKLAVFFMVISMSILRFMHAAGDESIAFKIFLLILMICLGAIAYLLTYAVCFEIFPIQATVQYHALREKAEEYDTKRLELEEKQVERKKKKAEFLLENELDLNRAIESMEDTLDNGEIKIVKDAEENARLAKEENENASAIALQEEIQKEAAEAAKKVANKKRERRRKRLGMNGVEAIILLMMFAFTSCNVSSLSTAQSIFIDPSGGAVNIIDVLGTGEEVLMSLGNDIESPNASYGKVDVFIMQEQTGTEHYSVSTPMLSLTAGLEQKKTRRDLEDFVSTWDAFKAKIQFTKEGYNQSRIIKPLFEVLDYTLSQPYNKKQVILHTDLLEHTQEMSFLQMKPQEIRANKDEIIEFLDYYCKCESLKGLDIQFAYRSRTESKYDQHRVEIEEIFEAYFLTKGATVRRFQK